MAGRSASEIARAVTGRYGLHQCQECAAALTAAFKAAGLHGERVRLMTWARGADFIVMKDETFRLPFAAGSLTISENGTHYGVIVEGVAYCNVFRGGVAEDRWGEGVFDCHGHRFERMVEERF